jgi:hypothetical protein
MPARRLRPSAVGADLTLASTANQQTRPLVCRPVPRMKMRLAAANLLDVDRSAE